MAIKSLNPYLNFDGTSEKALRFYETALGATVDGLMRFGESGQTNVAPEHRNRVMNARLRIGDGVVMMSDTMPGMTLAVGSNVQIVLDFDDVADMTKKFEALAAGGQITMPLQDTFWGARFGMLTDAFGIRWMFNCEAKKG
jgi:PhnB protein